MSDTDRDPTTEQPAEAPAAEAAPDKSEALAKEVNDLRDRLLRTLAEMENLRRRTEREVQDARSYGIAAFARDMIGVADNMRRALDSVGDAAGGVKSFVEGVELTERELLKTLEKHGVRKFDPKGEKFDPNIHQAMFEVPDPASPSGTIVQVVQPGYMIGERVLRPAMVGVAKGGPKPAPEQPGGNDSPKAQAEPQSSK